MYLNYHNGYDYMETQREGDRVYKETINDFGNLTLEEKVEKLIQYCAYVQKERILERLERNGGRF